MSFGPRDEQYFRQGVELMRAVNGDAAADAALERHERAVERGTTDKDDFAIRTAWGFMHHRPGLSLRDRAFAMMVSDIVQVRPGALGDHVRLALYAGMTRDEIEEVLFQLTLYIGFPTTREAGVTVRQVFAELDAQDGKGGTRS